MSSRPACIGFIGGSGLYDIDWLQNARWAEAKSSFGTPSDSLLKGELDGIPLVFLPRHGRGHKIPPTEVNYRANIDALKRAGVTDVIALSAVGSLREDLDPGTFVIVDQFVDRTVSRARSFFGAGLVAHVPMASPVCARLGDALEKSALQAGVRCIRGGTYVVIEGPQFSTRAESEMYRRDSCDVIGMTNMPEARLAREAELCYATVAMVTDWDCWKTDQEHVNVKRVMTTMAGNVKSAREMARLVVPRVRTHPDFCPCGCDRALEGALMTAPAARDPELVRRLEAVAGRVL
ncbi:MAG: S-methyl-5'-thioadenosine phosphorylase [Gemmatimonadales bacterium]